VAFSLTESGAERMTEYNFLADLLNKFSELSPWVQVLTNFSFAFAAIAMTYFFKESVVAITQIFIEKDIKSIEEKLLKAWSESHKSYWSSNE
jgi:hypothetical protein